MRSFIYTLEVLICVASIAILLVLAFRFPWRRADKSDLLLMIGKNALEHLYENESLREMKEQEVENAISDLLPIGVDYDVRICFGRCGMKEDVNKSVVLTELILAGNQSSFSPRVVRLFMWEK